MEEDADAWYLLTEEIRNINETLTEMLEVMRK